jgi:hypothetical protein
MPNWNTSLNQKTERKKDQNSLIYGRKTSFSAILKTCGKNFPIFLNIQALISIQNVAKNKNIEKYAFWDNVVFVNLLFGSIFWEKGLEKNSRWHPINLIRAHF